MRLVARERDAPGCSPVGHGPRPNELAVPPANLDHAREGYGDEKAILSVGRTAPAVKTAARSPGIQQHAGGHVPKLHCLFAGGKGVLAVGRNPNVEDRGWVAAERPDDLSV